MDQIKDIVVLGGGSGGFAAAVRAAQLGGSVALVEEADLGGNCMHAACIPLTFLMRVGAFLETSRHLASLGIVAHEPKIDLASLHQRKETIIEVLRMGTEEQLHDYGITVVQGRGRLASPDTVVVGDQRIKGRAVVIATGSVAGQLPVDGGDLPGVLSTRQAMELQEVPETLAVIGNEPWEIQFTQVFTALGSQVTLLSGDGRLLPEADREISQRLAKHLHDSGVDVRRGVEVAGIRDVEGDKLELILTDDQEPVVVQRVLASPRFPNSTGIGLRQVGIRTAGGAVVVDHRMRTNLPGVYAVGDVTGAPMWSHKANAEGITAAENAMGLDESGARSMDDATLPRCLHTSPEVAWVGLTAEAARERGLNVRVGKVPIAINPQAMILGQTGGAVKVVSGSYGKILGVHVMAPGAIDLVNVAAVAMLSEATVHELMDLIPAHPSLGETLVDAAMDVEGRSLHLPRWF